MNTFRYLRHLYLKKSQRQTVTVTFFFVLFIFLPLASDPSRDLCLWIKIMGEKKLEEEMIWGFKVIFNF